MADMLKLLSWNIKGANLAIKRKKLLLSKTKESRHLLFAGDPFK